MPPRGNFDDIIKQTVAKTRDPTVPNTQYKRLKLHEKLMEPPAKDRPKVKLEPGTKEHQYPHTRKYDYEPGRQMDDRERATRYLDELLRESDPQEKKMPRSEMLLQRKRIRREIADDDDYDTEFETFDPETPAERAKREASKKAHKGLEDLKELIKGLEQ